jgi:hypothetical protein
MPVTTKDYANESRLNAILENRAALRPGFERENDFLESNPQK